MTGRRSWLNEWEDSQEDYYNPYPVEHPYVPETKPTLSSEPILKTLDKNKFGETKYGQVTLFPLIDNAQENKTSSEKSKEQDY